MYSGPNELWLDAARRAKWLFDPAAATVALSVDGTESAFTATELAYLDGASTTPTASKVPIHNSSAQLPYRRVVVDDAATLTLTAAQSGALVRFDKVDGAVITLPAPAIGLVYDFVATASVTSNSYKVITNAGTTFLVGTIRLFDTDTLTDPLAVATANGSTHVAATMNGTTTGGLLGTSLRFTCIAATLWAVEGIVHASGNVATPFATS